MKVGIAQKFRIDIKQLDLNALRTRLAMTRWPDKETVGDWDQGIPLDYARDLASYWAHHYNWRICEARLNMLANYMVEVDGLKIHMLHIRSHNPNARPLLLTHGWPGSILEFLDVIDPLSQDFHLVIPSLPGYGFSEKPTEAKWDVPHIARAWDALMRSLGYDRYFAQGGDWGSAVTMAIGAQNLGACAGIHLNMVVGIPEPEEMEDLTDFEKSALTRFQWYADRDNGYAMIQATRPQTLGYALADSPAGQMAWMVEKFYGWTDCGHDLVGKGGGNPERAVSRDSMLDHVTLYWLTNSAASSARLYWHSFRQFGTNTQIRVPTACSLFPMEIMRLSRRWAEKRFPNIVYWNELERGGHFAAWEQPEVFVREVRAAFGSMAL